MSAIDQAIQFAAQAHAGQRRKEPIGGYDLPYISHPLEVLKLVWKWGASDPATSTAAVLHDVVEDCGVSLVEIEREFGADVATLVQQLTFLEGGDKIGYLESFRDPRQTRVEALVIKLADRVCNVRDYAIQNLPYAAKYLRKAAVLSEALAERREEICNRWNEDTAARVEGGWNGLWNDLPG